MRILWLATSESFYDYIASNSNLSIDSEGGWYTGLHQAIQQYDTERSIELGVAFTCNKEAPKSSAKYINGVAIRKTKRHGINASPKL